MSAHPEKRTGRKTSWKRFTYTMRKSHHFRTEGVLILLGFAIAVVFMQWALRERENGFSLNTPSPRTYFALSSMKYVDNEGTKTLRTRVGDTVAGVIVRDGTAKDRLILRIEALVKGDLAALALSQGLLDLLHGLPEEERKKILQETAAIGNEFLEASETDAEVGAPSSERIWAAIERRSFPVEDNNIIYQILDEILQPLTRVDQELTDALRTDIAASLRPVERTVEPGDILVEKGQFITPQLAGILKMQGYAQSDFPWKQIVVVLMIIPFWPVWLIIQTRGRTSHAQNHIPWLYISFIVGLAWFFELFSSLNRADGMASLFLAGTAYLTLPPHLALQVVLAGSILGGVVAAGFSVLHVALIAAIGILSAITGFYWLVDIDSRTTLWRKLFMLGLLQTVAGMGIRWGFGLTLSPRSVVILLSAGAVWSSLVIAALPLFESFFDVLSPLRLMELTSPSHPLLKKLQIEAPGTYHHSLILGTLAETAADRLGMNSAMVKAGAYFHDVGKLRRPHFFVENQMGQGNIHDTLKPSLSALVIIAHVREGLELAEEYRLPGVIRQFIAEHHGTTKLSYFYRKAKNVEKGVSPEQFSYPGPKPQSRETGLLMLVDSIEAAVRAEMRPSTSVTDTMRTIERVMDGKIAEGQLDGVDFTLKDLAVLRETLLAAFQSMYHSRRIKEIKDGNSAHESQDDPGGTNMRTAREVHLP